MSFFLYSYILITINESRIFSLFYILIFYFIYNILVRNHCGTHIQYYEFNAITNYICLSQILSYSSTIIFLKVFKHIGPCLLKLINYKLTIENGYLTYYAKYYTYFNFTVSIEDHIYQYF